MNEGRWYSLSKRSDMNKSTTHSSSERPDLHLLAVQLKEGYNRKELATVLYHLLPKDEDENALTVFDMSERGKHGPVRIGICQLCGSQLNSISSEEPPPNP